MRRVLILGGGFGGIAAAHTLRQKLPAEDEIVLIDRRSYFMVGFRKTWTLVGKSTLDAGQRSLTSLAKKGIQFIQGNITRIDPRARAAEIDGKRMQADAMILALGTELAPEQIPGFQENALNVYDAQDIPRASQAIANFSGGRIVVGIFGTPYQCPPAPYELALILQDYMLARGINPRIDVFSPQPMTLPVLGAIGCSTLEGRLAERGIKFLPNHKATAVEKGQVVFATERLSYDLLLGVPPHRCPQVVLESGLTEGGAWVRVNPRTLETNFPGVYAVGDMTEIQLANKMPLPKAGVFAEKEGQVTAERIAASFRAETPDATFDGAGYCFLEVGNGEAVLVTGNFLAEPAPQVTLTEASPEYLEQKSAFESQRLRDWFGG